MAAAVAAKCVAVPEAAVAFGAAEGAQGTSDNSTWSSWSSGGRWRN